MVQRNYTYDYQKSPRKVRKQFDGLPPGLLRSVSERLVVSKSVIDVYASLSVRKVVSRSTWASENLQLRRKRRTFGRPVGFFSIISH